MFVLRGFLETHILVLCTRQRQHSHQNGQNSEFAVEIVGSGNAEPLFPEILTRSDFAGKAFQVQMTCSP